MVDSTRSGDIVDERAAGTPELVVEADASSEAEEALQDPFAQTGQRAGAVALECQQVLAGPEDRLDALADGSEVRRGSRFVSAPGPDDRGIEAGDSAGELAAGVALVGEDRLTASPSAELDQLQADLTLVTLGGGELEGAGSAVRREQRMQPEAPEEARVRGAIAVVGDIGEHRALGRLAAAPALHGRRVDQEQIVCEAGAPLGEDPDEPLARVCKPTPTLVVARLAGQARKQVSEPLCGHLQEAAIGGDAHDRLGDRERDHLRVCHPSPRVSWPLGQEIVSRAEHGDAESVEVGVHRGLLVDGAFGTADFDLSARKPPINTAPAVESTI